MTHARTSPPVVAGSASPRPPLLLGDPFTGSPRVIQRSPVGVQGVFDLLMTPLLGLMAAPPRLPTILTKRMADLVLATALLVLAAPLLAVIALAVRWDSRGPALYSQLRSGQYGVPFRCWKFRTMQVDADQRLEELLASDPAVRHEFEQTRKLVRDPRITRLGGFLRRSSLDELPQLWNVLRGEMSLVGPRPVVPEELAWYGDAVGVVLTARPGITGAWQVSGRNDTSYQQRVSLDLAYARGHTTAGDVRILFSTIRVVASARGAY